MAVKFSHARIDENGNISGGRAGDNTTHEIETTDGYVHAKGWRVLRPSNPNEAKVIADTAVAIAKNDAFGYNQEDRESGILAVRQAGYNVSLVTKKCNLDCSSLVRLSCIVAGINVGDFYTGNEASVLLATKHFTEVPFTTLSALKRGDVLVTKTKGHTVVVTTAEGDKTVADGWVKEGAKWYYYENGQKAIKKWIKSNSKWYRVGNDGAMLTGFHLVWDDKQKMNRPCFFGEDGSLYHEAADHRGFIEVWHD